jgi:hydrogenase maturation protein HypF
MQIFNFPIKKKTRVLSLGAESAGRFAFYKNGNIFVSENFGDLLEEINFRKFKKEVLKYIKKEKPDTILTDLHPLYNSTIFGQELSQKLKILQLKIQHHIAHIFSAIGDQMLQTTNYKLQTNFIGIAADGTGYGLDGNIWGGEIFKCQISNIKYQKFLIERSGSLEEQTMIGGDLAVKEPARMLIAILAKIPNPKSQIPNKSQITNSKVQKDFVYKYVKKFYSRNEFELLYNQLQQGFNCQTTTSAGRILDAVSLLLGFADNKRDFKHEATKLLEKNSTKPYRNLEFGIWNNEYTIQNFRLQTTHYKLPTTNLFQYLLNNINKDKMRLAATAQEYIAKGFYEIVKKNTLNTKYCILDTYFAGGMANNKIMSAYLEKKGVYTSKKIPRGDEGIAFGQIVYYILNNHHFVNRAITNAKL